MISDDHHLDDSWRDEEEGGDAVGNLPSASSPAAAAAASPPVRPSLHGLDREFSVRFGALPTNNNNNDANNGNVSNNNGGDIGQSSQSQQQQQQQRGPNFTDYLMAQKRLQSQRKIQQQQLHLSESTAAMLLSMTATEEQQRRLSELAVKNDDDDDDGTTGNTHNNNVIGGEQQQQQLQPQQSQEVNLTALRAAAKFRAAAAAAVRNQNSSDINNHGLFHRQPTFDWDEKFKEIELIDSDGHFIDGHETMLSWYSPPVQRQRWGKDQMLPHVNWGDLFFDLFYVAAAYNLGVLLMSAMSDSRQWLRGIIYYLGTFGPLWGTWEVSMFYESRYTSVDYAHRMFEVVRYLFVSLAVVHVKPLDLLGDPKSAETLLFTSAILGEMLMHLLLCLEVYWRGQGDTKAIQNHTAVKIKWQIMPVLLIYVAAVVAAAVLFAQAHQEEEGVVEDAHYSGDGSAKSDAEAVAATGYDTSKEYETRFLAGESDSKYDDSYASSEELEPLWKLSDLPLTLTAAAYLSTIIVTLVRKMVITSGKHGDIRDHYVPNNVDYVIHRYGEWILLMIGEGILSLLIVETVEVSDYYFITTFGALTVIFIQILKFESEPHGGEHALWRNLRNGLCYSYLIQILSMSLICFGVTYKIFLKGVLKDAEKKALYDGGEGKMRRFLAASPYITDEVAAAVFSASLGIVLLSLELMCLTHSGVRKALAHLIHRDVQNEDAKSLPHWPVIVIGLFKLGIICFTVTLSQWTVDPAILTICGCCIVLALSITRVMNYFFIHKKEMIRHVTERMTSLAARVSYPDIADPIELGSKAVVSNIVNMITLGSIHSATTEAKEKARANESSHSTESSPAAHMTEKKDDDAKIIDLAGANSSFDGIVVANLNGIITQVNDTAVTLFGYATKQEMIGKNLNILCGGGDAKQHDGYMKAFKTRMADGSKTPHKVLGRQRMLHASRADGTEFPCIIGIKMVSNDTRIAGYIRDMSGVAVVNKRPTVNTNEEEAIKKVVNDYAFDAIIACNDLGNIQDVNEKAMAQFGYSNKNQLIGEKLQLIITGMTLEQLTENDGKQKEATLKMLNGKEFKCIIGTKKIIGSRNLIAVYIWNTDVDGIMDKKSN